MNYGRVEVGEKVNVGTADRPVWRECVLNEFEQRQWEYSDGRPNEHVVDIHRPGSDMPSSSRERERAERQAEGSWSDYGF